VSLEGQAATTKRWRILRECAGEGDQKFRREKKRKAQDPVMSIEIVVVGHFRLRAFDFIRIE
jgi:hypothetical protein